MNRLHGTMSAIILAGGRSRRMGSDKAFLLYKGHPFVSIVAQEMSKISNEIIVPIGKKDRREFESILRDDHTLIINDEYDLGTPLSGMLTALNYVTNQYAAVVACDLPLVKSEVVSLLYRRASNHSGAVPKWPENRKLRVRDDESRIEPLCAVYNVSQARQASWEALKRGTVGCRHMLSLLVDVCYVNVTELEALDDELDSLTNINTLDDYFLLALRKNHGVVNVATPRAITASLSS